MAITVIDKFIGNHTKIRDRINRESKRSLCITKENLTTPAMAVSADELALHVRVFNMHKFTAEALPEVLCNKDALTELRERLETARK